VADVGAGTGYYLARVLDDLPGAVGVALDVSKFALRRAARAHERIGAVVADAWRGLPLRDASVDVVINVFAPRNAAELARILRPGGALVVVTPTPRHLAELVSRLGLLTVDEDKDVRLRETLAGHFTPAGVEPYETRLALSPADVRALVLMGPSAWHVDRASIEGSIDALPDLFAVTLSVSVATFVRPPRG
jgi:23S rRNA (guanine745-N1)-methyltransferase